MCVCVCVCVCVGGGGGGGCYKVLTSWGTLWYCLNCNDSLRASTLRRSGSGREKEGELATTAVCLAILNICIKKVYAKC